MPYRAKICFILNIVIHISVVIYVTTKFDQGVTFYLRKLCLRGWDPRISNILNWFGQISSCWESCFVDFWRC